MIEHPAYLLRALSLKAATMNIAQKYTISRKRTSFGRTSRPAYFPFNVLPTSLITDQRAVVDEASTKNKPGMSFPSLASCNKAVQGRLVFHPAVPHNFRR